MTMPCSNYQTYIDCTCPPHLPVLSLFCRCGSVIVYCYCCLVSCLLDVPVLREDLNVCPLFIYATACGACLLGGKVLSFVHPMPCRRPWRRSVNSACQTLPTDVMDEMTELMRAPWPACRTYCMVSVNLGCCPCSFSALYYSRQMSDDYGGRNHRGCPVIPMPSASRILRMLDYNLDQW